MRLLLLLVVWMGAAPLSAQAPEVRPNAEVADRAIAQLRSPYCPGLMLEVCPSPQAVLLRDSIRDLAAEGRSASEIVEWTLARHGEEWRGVPERRGKGLWAWVIPPLALLAGAWVVATRLRRDRASAISAPGADVALSEGERERVAAALREWERGGEGEA